MKHLRIASLILVFGLLVEAQDRPNIVLIMADDIGSECFGLHGGTDYRTPVIDELAKTGWWTTQAYSQPLCTPSRVQIMTGRYNNRNYRSFGWLDPKETTFANLLKTKGYETCVAGKWQLGGNAGTIRDFGFDRHCLWNMLNYTALDTTEVSPVKSMLNRYKNPTLYRDGKWHKPGPEAFGPSECTDFICEFIDNNATKPFLAYYPMILTHSPFVPAPGKTGKKKKANFVSMTEYMDHLLGRIVATLDKNGIREKTMIIFTGDNGTHVSITSGTGKGPVRGGKAKMTNAGTHVPFIVNWPGVIKPAKSDELVDFSDVLPTLAQAAGVDIPKNVDGLSLLPVLRGETASRRDTAFCYYISKSPKTADRHFVRNRQYKLYGSGEFFKVRADPLEKSPITDPTAEEAVVKQALQTAAERYLKTR